MKRVFIGTSAEEKATLPILSKALKAVGLEPVPWTGAFPAGSFTLESLFAAVNKTDAAVFIMSLDDKRWYRGQKNLVPRDNLIFEVGLWMSKYGRHHVVLVVPKPSKGTPGLPSDLDGLNFLSTKSPLKAAPVASVIREYAQDICTHLSDYLKRRDPEPLRVHPKLKQPLIAKAEDVHYVEAIVGPWTAVGSVIKQEIRCADAVEIDILAAYQLGEILRDVRFRQNKKARLRVCLSNMYDDELLAMYLRKYEGRDKASIQEKFEHSIKEAIGPKFKKITSNPTGGVKISVDGHELAQTEVYLTPQRLTYSYYRINDLAWIIPLDIKRAKDPPPMCWGIAKETSPEVFDKYLHEFEIILREGHRAYP